jgi:hypothetical protein
VQNLCARNLLNRSFNQNDLKEPHLFSTLLHFLVEKNYDAPEAASKRHAPFYETNDDRFIASGQHQIDEIKCTANLCERNLTQKSTQSVSQANHRQFI